MKTVILAGGLGTRLAEETTLRPKPMVEIGGRPILWHIMQLYGCFGLSEFIVACGYKAESIKQYFRDFVYHDTDMTIDLGTGQTDVHDTRRPNWKVTLLDTGINTQTGGRIAQCQGAIGNNPFMATYGDGVGDIDIAKLLAFHRGHGKLATVTAVRPPARFGDLSFDDDFVTHFNEKSQSREGWINGGYFVFEPQLFSLCRGDECILERDVLPMLARERQLVAYRHAGFWQPMDTLREKQLLESLWAKNEAPWKLWK